MCRILLWTTGKINKKGRKKDKRAGGGER